MKNTENVCFLVCELDLLCTNFLENVYSYIQLYIFAASNANLSGIQTYTDTVMGAKMHFVSASGPEKSVSNSVLI